MRRGSCQPGLAAASPLAVGGAAPCPAHPGRWVGQGDRVRAGFDHELRGRLKKLTPDKIRAAVLRHGATLPGRERIAFLDAFAAVPDPEGTPAVCERALAVVGVVLEGRRMQ